MEKNNKLLAVRNAILVCFGNWELSPEECREVLNLCEKEVNTAENRSKFDEVKNVDFPVGENVCDKQTKGARPEDNK